MLPLPTEATSEAMNISTNRRHRFNSHNDHNRFRQFGFTQQSITVIIDKRGGGHGNLEWKGVIETLSPLLQFNASSDFDILMAGYFPYTAAQEKKKRTCF